MLSAVIMAFSTYTRIPMPVLSEKKASSGYQNMLCAFPVTGIFIGMIFAGAVYIMRWYGVPYTACALLMAVIPLMISGGIHMDGYMDVRDAVSSYGDYQKKISILKDPHVGAFAIIHAIIYTFLYVAAGLIIAERIQLHSSFGDYMVLVLLFTFERCICAIAALVFPKMKKDGMLYEAVGSAEGILDRRLIVLLVQLLAYGGLLFRQGNVGIGIFAVQFLAAIYYFYFSKRHFGGVNGDTSGWYLQMAELCSIWCIAVLWL